MTIIVRKLKEMKKLLIIRFSSFGDIVQSLSCIPVLLEKYPNSQIDFLTKSNFIEVVGLEKKLNKIHSFDKSSGIIGLVKLAKQLRKQNYEVVYDAHSNIRSFVVKTILNFGSNLKVITRKKSRLKRLFLFKFRKNLFDNWPFVSRLSFIKPLGFDDIKKSDWVFDLDRNDLPKSRISLVLGANWDLKIWPQEHWIELIRLILDKTSEEIVLLGGKLEQNVAEIIAAKYQERVHNYVDKCSLLESCYILSESKFFVSADTGLLHVGDGLSVPGVCLMGPTAFGYPASQVVNVLEVKLACRPCTKDGRGKCSQDTYKKCMVEITPEAVFGKINEYLS